MCMWEKAIKGLGYMGQNLFAVVHDSCSGWMGSSWWVASTSGVTWMLIRLLLVVDGF